MLISYLKIAWRNLLKQKVFALVNLVGMGAALCAVLLLSLTAYKEWSFDRFHEKRNHIYQIVNEKVQNGNTSTMVTNSVAEPLAAAVKAEIPGVKHTSYITGFNLPVRVGANVYYLHTQFANRDFFNMFSFPLVKGIGDEALRELNQVVITEATAAKLFSKATDAVGKSIEINVRGQWQPYIVGGIAENIPQNSSIRFDLVARVESDPYYNEVKGKWDVSTNPLLVELEPGVSQASFEKQLNALKPRYYAKAIQEGVTDFTFKTISLNDFRLDEHSYFFGGVNKYYPWLMVILSALIISIACINFINLSVARSLGRSAEIGLRKSLGAFNGQVFLQFWMESFLLCVLALVLGSILAVFILPFYNRQFSQHIQWEMLQDVKVIAGIIIIFFLITLLAGGFPAWKISRQHILTMLKGKMNINKGNYVRNSLIVVQFVVAVILFSCTAIIWQQLNYIRNKPLGYEVNTIASIPLDNATPAVLDNMKQRLSQFPDVKSVSAGMNNFGIGSDGNSGNWIIGFSFHGQMLTTKFQRVDYNYAGTMGMQMVEGRDFSKEFGTDSSAILINETMAKQLRVKEPLGTMIDLGPQGNLKVVGVIRDYHFESLRRKIDPLIIGLAKPNDLGYLFVNVRTSNPTATLDKIARLWKEVNPLAENSPTYLNDNMRRMYEDEHRFSNMLLSGAGLAIIITCMGLFAVTVLATAQRKKEISIRKVLGASVSSIVTLLTRDFLVLVLIAIVIAAPLSWYFMKKWLRHFEFHVSVPWWIFIVVGAIAILIAVVTISLQSIKAALSNPVKSLNRE